MKDRVNISHFYEIVINHQCTIECTIGRNTIIYQNVTIGGTNDGVPTIGENFIIGANSILLRNIVIGDNVIIGDGTVATKNIDSSQTIVEGSFSRKKQCCFN